MDALEQDGSEWSPEDRNAAEARRSYGVAVESTVERDEAPARRLTFVLPELERQLQRDLHGRRPVVAVEDPSEPGWRHLKELLGELCCRRVCHPGERGVSELLCLRCERCDEPRVAMAERGNPPARVGVDIAFAIHVKEPCSLCAVDDQRIDLLDI